MNDKIICSHIEIVTDGGIVICIDCGEQLKMIPQKDWCMRGSDRHQSRNTIRVTIAKDVHNMNISKNIIDTADIYFKELSKNHGPFKNTSRRGIIFACIYFAYNKAKKPQDVIQLMETFQLKKKRALRGLRFVQLNIPDDIKLVKCVITSEDLVEKTMCKFDASVDQIQYVKELSLKLDKNITEFLVRSRTSSKIAGLVYFYFITHNIDISLKKFSSKIKLTSKTVIDNTKEISRIFNVDIKING